ncbi:Pycsar system effector family protein [Lysinibacillus endophyticus]|uniref:Pycsar system effector family protein n=1 Tax=Ureibacillus endophyticus TaxID=1978490 RepID=UPI00209E9494|nr:Pycsar system effector family protein [Lysinibacillus endophyticus]MCP1144676.1 DUF5706 domain-containing protein [Lysinibacillus endophyticus]
MESQNKNESSEQSHSKSRLEEIIKNEKLQVETFTDDSQTAGVVKTNYSNNENVYLNNSIRFADTKAAALVAVNGLVAKFVFDLINQQDKILQIETIIGFIFLMVGIGLSVLVVFPQKANSRTKGIIYWENIIQMDLDEYINTVEEMPPKELRKQILITNYIQSKILTKKFTYLRYAFISSLIGYCILAFVAVITFLFN